MVVKELYESVAKLGFSDNLDDTAAFFAAANRALMQINDIKPHTSMRDVYLNAPENLLPGAHFGIDFHDDEPLTFETSEDCATYSFEVLGEGEYYIEILRDGEWVRDEREESFSTRDFEVRHGFIMHDGARVKAPARITFIGDYTYRVRGVAFYARAYSGDVEDIPVYSEYLRVDMHRLCDDFLSLTDRPLVDEFDRLTDKYFIEDSGVLLVSREIAEHITVKYKRKPKRIESDVNPWEDGDTEIDLDAALSELLPILTAVYIWLDEGDGKSATYLELYRERRAEIEANMRSYAPVKMKYRPF